MSGRYEPGSANARVRRNRETRDESRPLNSRHNLHPARRSTLPWLRRTNGVNVPPFQASRESRCGASLCRRVRLIACASRIECNGHAPTPRPSLRGARATCPPRATAPASLARVTRRTCASENDGPAATAIRTDQCKRSSWRHPQLCHCERLFAPHLMRGKQSRFSAARIVWPQWLLVMALRNRENATIWPP